MNRQRKEKAVTAAGASHRRCARITAAGTPEDVAKVKESYTGAYLKDLLGRRAASGKKQAAE